MSKKRLLATPEPWQPADYDAADVGAIKALARGNATPEQQQRALVFIVENLCGTYDQPWRPGGAEAERLTSFASGKRHVGLQIVKLTKIVLAATVQGRPARKEEL